MEGFLTVGNPVIECSFQRSLPDAYVVIFGVQGKDLSNLPDFLVIQFSFIKEPYKCLYLI